MAGYNFFSDTEGDLTELELTKGDFINNELLKVAKEMAKKINTNEKKQEEKNDTADRKK